MKHQTIAAVNRFNALMAIALITPFACHAAQAEPAPSPPTNLNPAGANALAAPTDSAAPAPAPAPAPALWSTDSASQLDQALADRARHGLDHVTFLKAPPAGATQAEVDRARSEAARRYAGALASGLIDPRSLPNSYGLPVPQVDIKAGLDHALRMGTLRSWLESLAPQGPSYRALSSAYLANRAQAQSAAPPTIPADGDAIHFGEEDPRVPAIARRLAALGYLSVNWPQPPAASVFTQSMADALSAFQRDNDLAVDGVVGKNTIAQLNLSPAARARAIAIALERERWRSRTPAPTRIDVNIAATQLTYWRDGKVAGRHKVIVGKPATKTVQLQAPFYRLVANPTWTVPRSIQYGEFAGKSAAYFASRNIVRRNGWLVQRSGPNNALGLVKIDLKDSRGIFLHDTNARTLFARTQRQFSHGCIRVDDALGLAALVAEHEGLTTQWEAATQTGRETFVNLPQPFPVRLFYQTAFVDAQGQVQVWRDPYGWDEAVAQRLGL